MGELPCETSGEEPTGPGLGLALLIMAEIRSEDFGSGFEELEDGGWLRPRSTDCTGREEDAVG